ncbi:PIN domain-containing protein [Pseudomonas sp. R2.Fl]|nr:PIN domain-containing protein [Pseudomonas sp. R2.Fl]
MTDIGSDVRLYIDTNIFIYFIEDKGPQGERAARLFIELNERRIFSLTSELAIAECLHGVHKTGRTELLALYTSLFETVEVLPLTTTILMNASEIGGRLNNKLLDAVHVAAALEWGCTHFLTNDHSIRMPPGLTRLLFSELTIGDPHT